MNERVLNELIEQTTSAWRPTDANGRARAHPAWHDLPEAGRRAAHDATALARAMESALDPEGLSTTGRRVLMRIRATPRT